MKIKLLAFALILSSIAPAFAGGYWSKPKEPTVQIPSENVLRQRAKNSNLPANIQSLTIYTNLAGRQMTEDELTQALDTIPRQLFIAIIQREGLGILIFFPLVMKLVREQYLPYKEALLKIFTGSQNPSSATTN